MISLYTAPSCTSCKKAKNWLKSHRIPFEERNIVADPLTTEEVFHVLRMCDDGIEGLVSTRNRAVKEMGVTWDDLPLSEAVALIVKNPNALRRPIIMDEKRLHVGYNEEEIRTFLPRQVRVMESGGYNMRHAG